MLAIITARGGSKRIPRKNIKAFMGKPMISFAITTAKESKLFDEIMVSTDDKEIAEIAMTCGANVPFYRSVENSDDFSTTSDVLMEVLSEFAKKGQYWENFCCIYPCVPLLTPDILIKSCKLFKDKNGESLVPVVKYSYPVQRGLITTANGTLSYREPEYMNSRSQDLESVYHDVGMFYFSKTESFLKKGSLITDKTIPYELPDLYVQDIDTIDDWKLAELKYLYLNQQKYLNL